MDKKSDIEEVLPDGLFLDEIPNVSNDDDDISFEICSESVSPFEISEMIRFEFGDDIKKMFGDSAEIYEQHDIHGCFYFTIYVYGNVYKLHKRKQTLKKILNG